MAIEIGGIKEDQYAAWAETVNTAFGDEVAEGDVERLRRILPRARMLAAFDEERIVGGAAAFPFSLTVPGERRLPAAGVTAVGVLPTHRRQGILRRLMARQLADAQAAGQPLAILWASEGAIYQRFGYGLASLHGSFDVERSNAAFRRERDWSGRVRLVDAAAARQLMPPVYDGVAARVPGFYERSAAWWESNTLHDPQHWRRGASRKFFAIHERAGRPTGYAVYRIKEDWGEHGSRSELRVLETLAVDSNAEGDVWRYLFGVDLIHRIVRWIGPLDEPLVLQLARPELLGLRARPGLWLRILDVPAALAGRGYAADGSLVLEVSDEFMPGLGGRWRLAVADGRAKVEATDEPAEIELETNDLASVYLGAFSFAQLGRAGRTRELAEGARQRADGLFRTDLAPWCPEIF